MTVVPSGVSSFTLGLVNDCDVVLWWWINLGKFLKYQMFLIVEVRGLESESKKCYCLVRR